MATAVMKSEPFLFLDQLSAARERLLLLDYDGTLAPFSTCRNRAFPYPQVPELIDSLLSTCGTRVVIISGRAAREIPALLAGVPQLEIWGSHGLERLWPDGRYEALPIAHEAVLALEEADARLELDGLAELCERKLGAIAVHWRGLATAHVGEVRTAAYRALGVIACKGDLRLTEFDGGLEIGVRSGNKEYAVRTVLSEVSEDAVVAYLGDDVTDEDAFQQVNTRGLSVLVHPSPRRTHAQLWLKPPEEVIQFLLDWVRACGGDV